MNKKFLLATVGILGALAVWIWYEANAFQQNAEIYFFDVGQGDATLIKSGRTEILIDGGPSSEILNKLGKRLGFFDRKIELVILTHPDQDHVAGLIDVFNNYEVGAFLGTLVNDGNVAYQNILNKIKETNTPYFKVKAGLRIQLGQKTILDVIYPFSDLENTKLRNTNAGSLVLKLDSPKYNILLTGDLESPEEYELLVSGLNLAAEILKIGHHGSKSSSAVEFLNAVQPQKAIISVGRKNRYGHPHEEVLLRLQNKGIEVLRTDILGDISFPLQ